MSIVSKPNNFTTNTTISPSEVNANFDTLYNDYNGSIAAANLASNSVTTAKIADSNVTTAKIADANVTSAKLSMQAWQSWTPTFANFTKGSATIDAKYIQIGKTVHYSLEITLSGSTMGTSPTFTLPVTATTKTVMYPMGNGYILDSGTASFNMRTRWASTTTVEMSYFNSSGVGAGITSTTPMTWANNDSISIAGTYEAA